MREYGLIEEYIYLESGANRFFFNLGGKNFRRKPIKQSFANR